MNIGFDTQIQNSNMLQYIFNQNYRQAHRFISSLTFLTSQQAFQNANFCSIRAKIKGEEQGKNAEFIKQCFQVLSSSKAKPRHMIRHLTFIHLLLQTGNHKNQQFLNEINKELNSILISSKQYCQKKQEYIQIPQTNPRLTRKRSKSDTSNSSKSSNFSNSINLTQQAQCFQSQKQNINKCLSISSASSKKFQYLSQNEVLCQKLIQPYCCYLLKKSAWQLQNYNLNQSQNSSQNDNQLQSPKQNRNKDMNQINKSDSNVQIWHQINLLKLIFKITQNYYIIMRYYNKIFIKLIIKVTQLLHQDIHKSYPNIVKSIKTKLNKQIKCLPNKIQQINKVLNINRQNNTFSNAKIQQNKQNISQQNQQNNGKLNRYIQLNQIKQLLSEVAQFNDQLTYTYRNKYIAQQLTKNRLKMPQLMNLDTIQCQYMLFAVKQQNKQKQKTHANKFKKPSAIRTNRSGYQNLSLSCVILANRNNIQNNSNFMIKSSNSNSYNCNNYFNNQIQSPMLYSQVNQTMTPNRLPKLHSKINLINNKFQFQFQLKQKMQQIIFTSGCQSKLDEVCQQLQ